MPESSDSPLERLQKRLYAPEDVPSVEESALPTNRPNSPERWKMPASAPASKKKISGAMLFLGFALAFFVVAGGITAAVLFLGGRSVSSDHIDISIEGPTTVAGGESVPLQITVKNSNPVAITGASLTLQFPEGTTDPDDGGKPLPHYTNPLGEIAAGSSKESTMHAAFFGTENQKVSIPITLEYHTGDSNAVFVKKATYEFTIATSPVGLTVTTLSEVSSGQPLTLSILARSNASAPLENVAIRAERYPSGFSASSATPTPVNDTLFVLGTLAPGEEREIRIVGTLIGQDGDERVFRFTAGTLKSADSREFAVSYASSDATVAIAKPFFEVGLNLNHDDAPVIVAKAGDPIIGLLAWTNALSTPIVDGTISVKLSGEALDGARVETTNGFYRSADKTVTFDRTTASGLASLAPGDTGNGSFTFVTKSGTAINALRNPSVTVAVSVSGRRVGQNNVAESISSTLTRTVKIQTDLGLSMRAVHSSGPFANTGPVPPVADSETTYTILLTATNSVNTVANTSVTVTLPSYVRFTGPETPAGAIKFNEATHQATWTIGDLAPGTSKDGAFQIALLPSVSQKGTSPILASDATITGFDRFVQKQISTSAGSVDTQTKTDPSYQDSFGVVK